MNEIPGGGGDGFTAVFTEGGNKLVGASDLDVLIDHLGAHSSPARAARATPATGRITVLSVTPGSTTRTRQCDGAASRQAPPRPRPQNRPAGRFADADGVLPAGPAPGARCGAGAVRCGAGGAGCRSASRCVRGASRRGASWRGASSRALCPVVRPAVRIPRCVSAVVRGGVQERVPLRPAVRHGVVRVPRCVMPWCVRRCVMPRCIRAASCRAASCRAYVPPCRQSPHARAQRSG